MGLYPLVPAGVVARMKREHGDGDGGGDDGKRQVGGEWTLPGGDEERDALHRARMDDETALRRRVYEVLLAEGCTRLTGLDGLVFDREEVVRECGVEGVVGWLRDVGVLAGPCEEVEEEEEVAERRDGEVEVRDFA